MDTLAARQQMVDQQVRTWEVLDPAVLAALAAIPREAFVPAAYESLAFADASIPIGFGQTMLAPKLQGRILQAIGIDPADAALEIGTGTGYLCACMEQLAGNVRSINCTRSWLRSRVQIFAPSPALRTSRRAMHSMQRLWVSMTPSQSPHRCRFTTAASSRRCGSVAGCSWSSG